MKQTQMKTFIKTGLMVLFFGFVYVAEPILELKTLNTELQEAALFGVGSDEFEPFKEATEGEGLKSKIQWALYIAAGLLILVLAYVFDVASYAQKLTGRKVADANKINAWMMLIFLGVGMYFAAWEFVVHGPETKVYNSSSEHGVDYDNMFMITLIFTAIVFVVTQVLLFVYSFIYKKSETRKATYYSHNNKLEIFWTIVPAIVLTILVLRGYSVWKNITYENPNSKKAQEIEVFAYQFGWTARYPGADNKFGAHSFNYISGTNSLGLAVESEVESFKEELKKDTADYIAKINSIDTYLGELKSKVKEFKKLANFKGVEDTEKEIAKVLNGEYKMDLELMLRRRTKQLERMALVEMNKEEYKATFNGSVHDDMITKEIVVLKNKPVKLKFRSRDIIHSAFLPDFRVQMNCVPGMNTEFTFVPTKTTEEIRKEKNNEEYNYYLYCNKICGQAHFNMKIKFVVVETETEYNTWIAAQKPAYPMQLPGSEKKEEINTPVENQVEESVVITETNIKKTI